jgi:hypothetical protein
MAWRPATPSGPFATLAASGALSDAVTIKDYKGFSAPWLGDLDSNQGCPGQSREFYR